MVHPRQKREHGWHLVAGEAEHEALFTVGVRRRADGEVLDRAIERPGCGGGPEPIPVPELIDRASTVIDEGVQGDSGSTMGSPSQLRSSMRSSTSAKRARQARCSGVYPSV